MIFSGAINLQGGGFSSVVWQGNFPQMDLSGYAGFWVETGTVAYGNNNVPLGIHLQLSDSSSYWSYAAPVAIPFSSSASQRHKLFVPLASFDFASSGGRRCSTCKLNVRAIRGLAIYILYQNGPFELKIYEISAVRNRGAAPIYPTAPAVDALGDHGAVARLLQNTISAGGFTFDKGYHGICAVIYASVARSILTAARTSAAAAGLACAGLARAQNVALTSAADKAWVLRRAFDAILADHQGVPRAAEKRYPAAAQGAWLPSTGSASEQAILGCSRLMSLAGPVDSVNSRNNVMNSDTTTNRPLNSGDNVMTMFVGPFAQMGISGHNDLGLHHVSTPAECAHHCSRDARCKSFDYGARGHVSGECWLSTANRHSAGHAYTRWEHYDYYERKPQDEMSGTTSGTMPGTKRGSTATKDLEDTESNDWLLWLLLGAAFLILILVVVIIYLLIRKRKSTMSTPSNSGQVVMGRPVQVQPKSEAQGVVIDNAAVGA